MYFAYNLQSYYVPFLITHIKKLASYLIFVPYLRALLYKTNVKVNNIKPMCVYATRKYVEKAQHLLLVSKILYYI